MKAPVGIDPRLAAALRGDAHFSGADDTAMLLQECRRHDVAGLLYQRLQLPAMGAEWETLRRGLGSEMRALAARELVRRREITKALNALAAGGVHPILIKGTALAYTIYPTPAARPRCDTDLLLPRDQIDAARRILLDVGYQPTPYCAGEFLLRQFEMHRTDVFGIVHALDIHWNVSTQTAFSQLMTYREMASEAVPVPALGPQAHGAGRVHALLLACVHPAMHHRNERTVVWTYDVHLLASAMPAADLARLARVAVARKVAAIVRDALMTASDLWQTPVPNEALRILSGTSSAEPSAAYLAPGRLWRHELADNIRNLTAWRERVCLLREIAFPDAAYMRRIYRSPGGVAAAAWLPMCYIHRLTVGTRRVLFGRK